MADFLPDPTPLILSSRVRAPCCKSSYYYELLLKLSQVQDPKRQRVGLIPSRTLGHESDMEFYGRGWMKIEVVGGMKKKKNAQRGK